MTELVERYKCRVYALCYRMLGHRQDAEDVTQQTFVRVLENLGRWDPEREFEPWLLAIAGNRCRTALSVRARRKAMQSVIEPVEDKTPDPQAERQLSEELTRALRTLRVDHREAFVLFHEQELSYEQIARRLDCPVGTVKTWIHRGRERLRHLLEKGGGA